MNPMFIAHYQHSPEDVAVGFGATAMEAADALVKEAPWLAGKEIDVAEVEPGTAAISLALLSGQVLVVDSGQTDLNPRQS